MLKIVATTLGETGGDAVTMSMDLGYLVGTAIFAAIFVLAVSAQIAANRFRPLLFWGVIVASRSARRRSGMMLRGDVGEGVEPAAIVATITPQNSSAQIAANRFRLGCCSGA